MTGYGLAQWVLYFFIYSFLGWVWESCLVSVQQHRWVNRGFLNGPFLPIYGFGAVAILLFTWPVQNNTLLVFAPYSGIGIKTALGMGGVQTSFGPKTTGERSAAVSS